MSQVRVVLRSQAIDGGCQKTRECLCHELGITVDASPAEIILLDSEVPDDRSQTLRQTLEALMRSNKLQLRLGPVTHDGESTVYLPAEREVVCAASRRLREALTLPLVEDPDVIPLMLVVGDCRPREQLDIIVGAFSAGRLHDVRTPVPFGIAVHHRQGDGWREMYALN